MEHQKLNCRLCYDEVKTEHGNYICLKQDCDYVYHVKCVAASIDLYEIIDPNEIEDLLKDKPVESCITCVIERNESVEALKIKHLFHEHELMLIKEEDVDHDHDHKQCDGCTGTWMVGWFLYLSPLNQMVFLSANLVGTNAVVSSTRTKQSLGFCAFDVLKFQVPSSILDTNIFSYVICIVTGRGSALVVVEIDHNIDLTYRDKSDDPTQHHCDICEEVRNPDRWLYHCSICDNSVHPRCVLGGYSFIKIGSMYKDEDHPHPLTFVQKIYYYPKCAKCGDYCPDLSLECATCNYIVHWECNSPDFED
ncbi:DC1 domain-containing protein [Corchorus olitorius]|uniref:DC1 domain-containing protein n=1 Tax=Corchorus olitorius TaxID=93759 RepID=A0A1R3KQD5_9ROSI|nr:DC1 domain-containing protein [Corchorus olitorius]